MGPDQKPGTLILIRCMYKDSGSQLWTTANVGEMPLPLVRQPLSSSTIRKPMGSLCACHNSPCVKECHLLRVFGYFPVFSMSVCIY